MKLNRAKKAGIVFLILGIACYFLIDESYGWISGGMLGAGLGLLLFFGSKKGKNQVNSK